MRTVKLFVCSVCPSRLNIRILPSIPHDDLLLSSRQVFELQQQRHYPIRVRLLLVNGIAYVDDGGFGHKGACGGVQNLRCHNRRTVIRSSILPGTGVPFASITMSKDRISYIAWRRGRIKVGSWLLIVIELTRE
jgi:hypothetical protein